MRNCVMLVAAISAWAIAAQAANAAVTVTVAGPLESAIAVDRFDCGSRGGAGGRDVPDTPPHAFRDSGGNIHFFANTFLGFRFGGRDFDHLAHPDCEQMKVPGLDPEPAHFRDHEWLVSPYSLDGTHVYALVHNEYFGWTYNNSCAQPADTGRGKHCWYMAITSAWSNNGGRSFEQPPAGYDPMVATLPYRFSTGMASAGYGNPTNIVRNPHDNYYYALIGAFAYGDQKTGRCLIRTRDFHSWRFWTGKDFSGQFIDPYKTGDSPDAHICPIVYRGSIMSIVYSPSLDTFIGVGNGGEFGGGADYTSSRDLIHWAEKQTLVSPSDSFAVRYPSIIDPKSSARNFDTTGGTPYLYFVRYGGNVSGRWIGQRSVGRIALRIGGGD
jgi:hypothetical protein